DRLACHREGRHDPGLPAHRAPRVRTVGTAGACGRVDRRCGRLYRASSPAREEARMKFVQTVAWKTSRPDEMREAAARFQADNPDPGPGFIGFKMLKNREQEDSYLVIAEFEDYDLAMQNSARPEVDAFNKELMALAEGPPTFGNYDVIDEM